ncbi:MAG: primosomal protein N', partial [Pseudomonadota bacterium]
FIETYQHEKIAADEIVIPTLSAEQENVAKQLIEQISQNNFNVNVIDGVTGSGKTETYCEAINHILQNNSGQILILLPEIALTNQIFDRFTKRFGMQPAIWHSNQTKLERARIWRAVNNKQCKIVIGARSALFLPFSQLKLIIVDEEHESSYKQEEGVIYHGRDIAIMRAYYQKISIILASATPSIETIYNIEIGKYNKFILPSRYGVARLPTIIPIDMRQQNLQSDHWISDVLKKKILDNFASNNQSMLYINRRGYAPLTICKSCGHKINCKNCSGWLTVHYKKNNYILQCHHCGYSSPFPDQCENCEADSSNIIAYGPAIQKIAQEVESFLPEAKICLMASDISDAEIKTNINKIIAGEFDIIIGTQLLCKGHHFPHLNLVGILDSEIGINGGDIRGNEKMYQLLHQVAGRAGREEKLGYVYIQTYVPDSPIIETLVNNQRNKFMQYEINNRREANMPPFSKLINFQISGYNEQEVIYYANYLCFHEALIDLQNITIHRWLFREPRCSVGEVLASRPHYIRLHVVL